MNKKKKFLIALVVILVPVIGFALSTLSLKLVRKIWQNKKRSFTKFVRLFYL